MWSVQHLLLLEHSSMVYERDTPTTDDIEMRLCCDENRDNEDVLFQILEIYVQ